MGKLADKIKELEERVSLLEKTKRRGDKSKEVADWIWEKVSRKGYIKVSRLFDLGLKMGYRYQTIQLARRHLLDDKVGIEFNKKLGGWIWVNLEEVGYDK